MRIILEDALFLIDDECYMVKNYHKDEKLKEGYAYVMNNDLVYPYRGKYDPILSKKPGLYSKKDTHIKIPFPKSKWDDYSADRIISIDVRAIIKEINRDPHFIDDETVEEALSNGEMLRPVIKESDDFLKYLIKRIILIKGVSVSHCKKFYNKNHEFPNLKQALEKDTKMTVTNFKRWADLLNFDYKVIITDKEGKDIYDDVIFDSRIL